MPSKIWSISSEPYLAVPLNKRCSIRCDRPASASLSALDPTPTQKPSDTDRTEGIASVTIRTPESSVVNFQGSWPGDRPPGDLPTESPPGDFASPWGRSPGACADSTAVGLRARAVGVAVANPPSVAPAIAVAAASSGIQ